MAVRLGPFEIQSQFASGGMGEIWRGIHVEQQVPVAIKVITGGNALMPEYQEEFRREVQAVARLHHPNVVQIFDYGNLPEDVRELPGKLIPGSPYLVMEYASRGSLGTQIDPLNWRDIKNILMSVLGALCHAHACGLIHRDIKPGNVLLGSHHESPPRIILTDFGVAHAKDAHTRTDALEFTSRSTEEATGTPRYMAPEQFMGKWRDYGPWTDLYAVGIMAYQLVTGDLPFKGATFMMLAMAHINETMPVMKPRVQVPIGLDAWVKRMTAKEAGARFRSAADAAWALTQLDDSAILFGELSNLVGQADDDELDDATDMMPTRVDFALPEAIRIFTMSRTAQKQAYVDAPSLPLTWQEAEPPRAQTSLVGAGLGLFGLRSIPLVDREQARTAMWDAFKRVYLDGKSQAIVLRGLTGSGKTRLGAWLCQMLAEIGAATVMQTSHGEIHANTHGLSWLLTSYFRSAGLSAEDMQARVAADLQRFGVEDAYEVHALTEIMRANMVDTDRTSRFVQFTSPEQRYVVLRRALGRLSKYRPIVVFLDDVHWSWDSIEFARYTVQAEEQFPILFVLTVRDETLAERPEENEALSALLAQARCHSINVDPLSRDHIRQLLQIHLALPSALSHDVAGRSAGSPLFAVQLVEDWVKRGVLVAENGVLVVNAGETANVPRNLSAIWESRVDFVVHQFARPVQRSDSRTEPGIDPISVREALECAAALGQDVVLREWEKTCQRANLPIPTGLVDELIRLRLAIDQEGGFAFINNQLRNVLIQTAQDSERWAPLNLQCAQALMSLYAPSTPGLAQRVGRHFVEGKAYGLAITCLEEAYQRAHGAAEQRDTTEIVDLLESAYLAMGLSQTDVRWAELWVRRGVPMVYSEDQNTFQHGMSLLQRAEELARTSKKPQLLANVLRAQAWASVYARQIPWGLELAKEALELSEHDEQTAASCHRTLGHLHLHQNALNEARFHFERTIEISPSSVHAVWARLQLGDCAVKAGEFDVAHAFFANALEESQKDRIVMIEAQVRESQGLVAYLSGLFSEAEDLFKECLRIRELLSGESTLSTRAEELVARASIAQGNFENAHITLGRLREHAMNSTRALFLHPSDALLTLAALAQDHTLWEDVFEEAVTFEREPELFHQEMLLRGLHAAKAHSMPVAALCERLLYLAKEFDLPTPFLATVQSMRSELVDEDELAELGLDPDEIMEQSGKFPPLPPVAAEDDVEDSEPEEFEPVQMVRSDALEGISSSHLEVFDPQAGPDVESNDDDGSKRNENE